MKKFSELSTEERLNLGMDFGHGVQGGCESPEDLLEDYLASKGIEADKPPLDDTAFTEGVDRIAECCDDCGWYVEPCQLNDNRVCGDCAPSTDDDEDWID